jgi:hypothetical protein
VSIGYARGDLPPEIARRVAERAAGRDIASVVPQGMDGLRQTLERYVDVGFSKFVVRPVVPPDSWRQELEELAEGVLDLRT